MYKLPKEEGGEPRHGGGGDGYLLLEKGGGGWTDGKGTVNDSSAALGRTVGQLYSPAKVCPASPLSALQSHMEK